MPRKVGSLKDAALTSLAKNIDYWADWIPDDANSYLYLLSPFEMLDYGLTQLVLDALVKYKTFHPKHVHLLLHSKLDSFDLSKCSAYKLGDSTLKILFKRCKKIKALTLSGRTRYSRKILNMVPLQYPDLQRFVISHECIADDLILNLVSNCKNLDAFQSTTCCKIAAKTFEEFKSLKHLRFLSLGNADALSEQCLLGILQSCTKLNRLCLPMTRLKFDMFCPSEHFHLLQSLDLTLGSVDDSSMERICACFPSLVELCLSNCEKITERTVSVITEKCKHLQSLNLSFTGIKDFSVELETLLETIGTNLHSIDVSGISGLKISSFGKNCPNLVKLYMNHCPYILTEWTNIAVQRLTANQRAALCQNQLENNNFSLLELCPFLVVLQIDARNKPARGSAFNLEHVLRGGKRLKFLTLNSIPGFTDNDVISLNTYMNVSELTYLNISGNTNVSPAGICYLIDNMYNLQTIKVTDCDIVTMEYDEMRRKYKKKCLEIEIIR